MNTVHILIPNTLDAEKEANTAHLSFNFAYFTLQTAYCSLHISNYTLHTAYIPLHTTHFTLHTTHSGRGPAGALSLFFPVLITSHTGRHCTVAQHCTAIHGFSTVQCTLHCTVLQPVKGSAVQCSAVQCSSVKGSAVQCSAGQLRDLFYPSSGNQLNSPAPVTSTEKLCDLNCALCSMLCAECSTQS